MIKMSSNSLLIKLADRLHNIMDARISDPSFRERYIKETELIAKSMSERILHESKLLYSFLKIHHEIE